MGTVGTDSGKRMGGAAVPMISVLRGGVPDMEHLGFACLVDSGGKILWSLGDPKAHAFFRSSAKPLQALAVITSGAADASGLDEADLAILCGSHAGGPDEKARVESVLAKSGLSSAALGCGDGLADMCSGKHAGMLTACRHLGMQLDTYLESGHPWQRYLLSLLCDYCGFGADGIVQAVDGCSAPTFSLPVYNMALGFARLAAESAQSGPAARVLGAMARNPGGHTGEPDLRGFRADGPSGTADPAARNTERGLASRDAPMLPSFVTKGGANGLHCGALPGLGLGFALKIADGAALPRWPVFTRALEKAGIIGSDTAGIMREALWPRVSTRRGAEAGHIRPEF